MRAVAITSFGEPDVLSVVDLPVPQPGAGQVRIKVAAAAVNNFDLVARAGWLGPMLPAGPQYVFGWDVAGTVDALGAGTTGYAVGDAVIGMSDWLDTKAGTQAEYVVLDTAAIAPAPSGVSLIEAATLPVNALTVLQSLDLAALQAGETLAVTGAAGAVGGYAVELARQRGLKVVAISASRDEPFLVTRGATFVPRSDDPVRSLHDRYPDGVDAVLDAATIGPSMIQAVRDGGVFVSLTPPKTPEAERGIRVYRAHAQSDGRQLRALAELVGQGHLTLRVAETFSFEDAPKAHAAMLKGGLRGRVVLVP
ncbi:NADP-dependent oxidoreductase [Paractinoplanes toevensis]|uniref:NADPH:quinone reductase n=1 Tax=Paractinoplanes toevensis TaxID=571911 RepID=A0A919W585_9ACTN|nr:NADP-dependent oxidoreductase [Actinoplanes toevensis]GIM92615.1 NADPH:quinone reductase [Actinoplanes toevensis]